MPLTHLLDTSVLSQPLKDKPVESVLSRWESIGDPAICTSAICLAELLHGLETRQSEKYWRRFKHLLENRYPALPFDQATASAYARMAAELRRAGNTKPTVDLFIAATASQNGLILVTLNEKDFAGIPGLIVENWAR